MSDRVFTVDELLRQDGKDGASVYVAVAGLVYDVTGSYHWRMGRHHVLHSAGQDLTGELAQAPHGANVIERFPVIGRLETRDS